MCIYICTHNTHIHMKITIYTYFFRAKPSSRICCTSVIVSGADGICELLFAITTLIAWLYKGHSLSTNILSSTFVLHYVYTLLDKAFFLTNLYLCVPICDTWYTVHFSLVCQKVDLEFRYPLCSSFLLEHYISVAIRTCIQARCLPSPFPSLLQEVVRT